MTEKHAGAKHVLRVYYTYVQGHEVPLIRLEGLWLTNLGFTAGNQIFLEGKSGELTIKSKEPRADGCGAGTGDQAEYPYRRLCHGLPHRCRHCRRQLYFFGCSPEYSL